MVIKSGIAVLLLYIAMLPASQVVVVGCGYVGLTLAAVLASANHMITCVDSDTHKIQLLQNKQLPFYEPGLTECLFDNAHKKRITFCHTNDYIPPVSIYYVCVPTPVDNHGACDDAYVRAACAAIIDTQCANEPIIIVVKSTVAPGTLRALQQELSACAQQIDIVYNPEFMREGTALQDMYRRNPIVLGAQSEDALCLVEQLLAPCLPTPTGIIKTDFETAELIKYAWNAFSATRIAYVNELALLCRALHADIAQVIQGLALSEQLLPTAHLKPGPGYGGSCLPKDTAAFAHTLEHFGLERSIIHRTIESNQQHKATLAADIVRSIGPTMRQTKTVALLGLAFKAHTNDVRQSAAIDVIKLLRTHGITIRAYDPCAMTSMRELFEDVMYCTCAYQAVEDVDCIVVLTEWPEFRELDLSIVASVCKKKKIIDTRNIFNPASVRAHGFEYLPMGAL